MLQDGTEITVPIEFFINSKKREQGSKGTMSNERSKEQKQQENQVVTWSELLMAVYVAQPQSNTWAQDQAQSTAGSAHTRATETQSNPIQFHKFSPIP